MILIDNSLEIFFILEFELTGSPLHTSLDDSLINSPLTQAQVKINEYYNHSPLSVDQALRILNLLTLSGNPSFEEKELPVWVLCDASDVSQTVLITLWRRDDGWMVRGTGTLAPSHLILQNFNPSLDVMLKDHLQSSMAQKNDVSYEVKACYNCNKNEASEIVDELADNGSSLKMHLSWKRPHSHFGFPPYDSVSRMEVSVTVGYECSALWQEIEKLQEINVLMDSNPVARENHSLLSMATVNLTVMTSSLRSQVHSYVCAGKLPPSFNSSKPPSAPKNGVGHVLDICEEVAEGRRHNMDLTEVLWSILKGKEQLISLLL
ncbi:uncharacterized protein [Hetaerina americana]|uniref:uncharacterized protein n=1 Tax=Hetaerina americana TaxID=62018 RepID=UPI003A7F3E98